MRGFAGRAGWRRRAVVIGGLGGLIAPLTLAVPASAGTGYNVIATVGVGNGPGAVAVNPSTDTVYVANGDGTVSVIDGTSNAVTHTISVGGYPTAVAVDASTDTVYVADGNSVLMIDGSSNAVTGTISDDNGPSGVAVDPTTDTVYTSNAGDDSVSVIDPTTKSVTATIEDVGDSPDGIAVDPATNTIYVTNQNDDGAVTVIDGATNDITTINTSVGPDATGVAVDAATDTIYVANQDVGTVSVIDGTTNTVTGGVAVGAKPYGVAVDSATDTVYTTTLDGPGLTVFDGATDAVITTVNVGAAPYAVDVDPATGTAFVANYTNDNVSVVSGPTPSCSTGGPECSMTGTAVITGGSLTLQAPPAVQWSDQLTGVDQQIASTPVSPASDLYTVTDPTGTAAGWSVAVSATPFTGTDFTPDANTLPGTMVFDASDSSPTVTTPLDSACVSGSTCTEPVNSVSLPQNVTAGAAVPTQLVNAGVGTGMGSIVLGTHNPATFWLSVPANTVADTYDSTIDLSVSSGPSGL